MHHLGSRLVAPSVLVLVLSVPAQSMAHHAFAAEFDINKPITLRGTVSIVVSGYQAKNGENKMNGGFVTLKDGTRLFAGGSAPNELPQK
jgi:Family of unknown function (DUF6152)